MSTLFILLSSALFQNVGDTAIRPGTVPAQCPVPQCQQGFFPISYWDCPTPRCAPLDTAGLLDSIEENPCKAVIAPPNQCLDVNEAPVVVVLCGSINPTSYQCTAWPLAYSLPFTYEWFADANLSVMPDGDSGRSAKVTCIDINDITLRTLTVTVTSPFGPSNSKSVSLNCQGSEQ